MGENLLVMNATCRRWFGKHSHTMEAYLLYTIDHVSFGSPIRIFARI